MQGRFLLYGLPGFYHEGEGGGGAGGGSGSGGSGGTGGGAGAGGAGAGEGGTGGGGKDGEGAGNPGGEATYPESHVRALRDENARYRQRAVDAETKLKDLTPAATRAGELEAEVGKLKAELHSEKVRNAAIAAGAHNPERVAGLIPADAQDVGKALEALKKSDPYLFRTAGDADGSRGNGAGAGETNGRGIGVDRLRGAYAESDKTRGR
jgi:hypothetical protein